MATNKKYAPKSAESTVPSRPPTNPFPKGDEAPGSRAARQIRAAEYDAMAARVVELEGLLGAKVAEFEAAELARLMAAAERDDRGGETSPERMRKVIGQPKEADVGPTEAVLREMLLKSPKDFIATMEEKEERLMGFSELKSENADLKEELEALRPKHSGPDKGAAKSRELLEGLFASYEESANA